MRVHEAATGKKSQGRKQPYESKKPQAKGRARENKPVRHSFVVELKDLIDVPNIAERLKMPTKNDKVLGPHKDAWCEFHQAFGHPIRSCLALGHQLNELVKSGFLNDYLAESQGLGPQQCQERIRGTKCPYMGRSIQSQVDSQVEGALPLSVKGIHVR